MPYRQMIILWNAFRVDCADLSGIDVISTHFEKVSIMITTYTLPSGAGGSIPTTVSIDHCWKGALPLLVGIKNGGGLNLDNYFCLCKLCWAMVMQS
jgi:hypothetical protein